MLSQNLASLTSRCAELDREREGLVATVESKNKQLVQVSEAVMQSETKDGEILRLKTACANIQSAADESNAELTSTIDALTGRATSVNAEVSNISDRLASLQSALDTSREESKVIRDHGREKDVQIKELELFQGELAAENDDLRGQLMGVQQMRERDARMLEEEISRERECKLQQDDHSQGGTMFTDPKKFADVEDEDMDKYFLNESSLNHSHSSGGELFNVAGKLF